MSARDREPLRVLTIDPTSRGFGFAVLEGPGTLVDWGVRSTGRGAKTLDKVGDLISHYRPDVVVLEDCSDAHSRRRKRACALIAAIVVLANRTGVATKTVSITAVHQVFGEKRRATKEHVAKVIAEHFAALAPRLPPKRKLWMPEDERMAIFDAVAFALSYYFFADAEPR